LAIVSIRASAGPLHKAHCTSAPSCYYRYHFFFQLVRAGDCRGDIASAALGQAFVGDAPVVFLVAAVVERSAGMYCAYSVESSLGAVL
jgi:hypothetical protein